MISNRCTEAVANLVGSVGLVFLWMPHPHCHLQQRLLPHEADMLDDDPAPMGDGDEEPDGWVYDEWSLSCMSHRR